MLVLQRDSNPCLPLKLYFRSSHYLHSIYSLGLYPLGAPNDGFLLNLLKTFFKAIQRTFISPEMHSKRRYKICVCVVFLFRLGQRESFRNFKGFMQYYFPQNFRRKLTYYENDSSLHHIFKSENFRFIFSYEK